MSGGLQLTDTSQQKLSTAQDASIQAALKTLRDNLSAFIVLDKTTPNFGEQRVLEFVEKLDELKFEFAGDSTLDFARSIVGVSGELCDKPESLACQLLHCVVSLTNKDVDLKTLPAQIHKKSLAEARDLFKMLVSKEGKTFGLADEYFLTTILDVLEPTAEELDLREQFVANGVEEDRKKNPMSSEPSISKDLSLLYPLLRASLKHRKIQQAIETSYKFFGRELDQALLINNREERESKVQGLLSDLINVSGKFILVEAGEKLDSLSKLGPKGSKKLVDWLSRGFEGYLLSRGAESVDVSRHQERIKFGLSQLNVKTDIFSYLRIDGLVEDLYSKVASVSLTKTDIDRFKKTGVPDSPLTQGLLAVAGTGQESLNLTFSPNSQAIRIGYSGDDKESGVSFEQMTDPKNMAKACTEYSEALSLKTLDALRPSVLAKLARYKELSDLVKYLPDGLSELVFVGLQEGQDGAPGPERLLPHLLDMYYAPGTKTIQDTWSKWCDKSKPFNKSQRQESIDSLKVKYPNSIALHQHDTLLAASFLAVVLSASHRSHLKEIPNVQGELAGLVQKSNNNFYVLTQVLFESVNLSEESAASSQKDTVTVPGSQVDTDVERESPKRKWLSGMRAKQKTPEAEEVKSYSLVAKLKGQELKPNFKGFVQRISSYADELVNELPNLSTEDQKRAVIQLLSGGSETTDFDKFYRAISKKTHPDILSQTWPDSKEVQEHLKSVFQSVTDLKVLLFDQGEYSLEDTIKAIDNVNQKLDLFEELKDSFQAASFSSSEGKEILESVRANTERLERLEGKFDDLSNQISPK